MAMKRIFVVSQIVKGVDCTLITNLFSETLHKKFKESFNPYDVYSRTPNLPSLFIMKNVTM